MDNKKLEKWLSSVDSRHRAVLLVSKRARQIQKGLRPYFDSKSTKVTIMALEEFIQGKIDWYELSEEEIEALKQAALDIQESEETSQDFNSARTPSFEQSFQPDLDIDDDSEEDFEDDADLDDDPVDFDQD